jgi:peptide-methionine (S)-S-oxide reductase
MKRSTSRSTVGWTRNAATLMLALLLAAAPFTLRALSPSAAPPTAEAVATFAGGCFWCMEAPFDKLPGVRSVESGYIGGHTANPTYQQISTGGTGHAEAVRILYDPTQISYEELLYVFWRNIDPLVEDRQFCDRGSQYRSAIFIHDAAQQAAAEASRRELEAAGRFPQPIVTEIVAAGRFYPAEEEHQGYYQKNPLRYKYYRFNCGRDARLRELWGAEAGGAR